MGSVKWPAGKGAQAAVIGAAAVLLVAVIYSATSRKEGNFASVEQTSSVRDGAEGGASVFALPQASRDFVGAWYGVLRATRRDPPNAGAEQNGFGTSFMLVNDRVVMKLALWAPPDAKITRLQATGIDAKRVRVEDEIEGKDSLGAAIWVHERYDIALLNRDELECVETVTYYRDSSRARPAGSAEYRGRLKRAGDAEMRSHVEEMERKGLKKKAETEAAVPSR
jgi:hypothetical protein